MSSPPYTHHMLGISVMRYGGLDRFTCVEAKMIKALQISGSCTWNLLRVSATPRALFRKQSHYSQHVPPNSIYECSQLGRQCYSMGCSNKHSSPTASF